RRVGSNPTSRPRSCSGLVLQSGLLLCVRRLPGPDCEGYNYSSDQLVRRMSVDRVGIYDAKARLSELIAEVARGGEVVITKRGKAVARLVPPASPRKDAPARAARRIRALSERLNIRRVDVRELIGEGRD